MGLRDENLRGVIDGSYEFLNTVLFAGFSLDVKEYENYSEFADFKKNLKQKIENGKFKDGENEIFKKLENIAENRRKLATDVLRVAFWFYFKLNGLSDKVLEDGGFTRLDVLRGMQEIENILTNC